MLQSILFILRKFLSKAFPGTKTTPIGVFNLFVFLPIYVLMFCFYFYIVDLRTGRTVLYCKLAIKCTNVLFGTQPRSSLWRTL